MKKNLYYIITVFLVFLLAGLHSLTAQETLSCKVLIPEISDSYKGECKKGLANGVGEATGKDFYSGEFKNGLPHGQGKYIWANGDNYQGEWKKGKRDGFGNQTIKVTGRDSSYSGYWGDNIYIGKNKYSFLINNKTINIDNIRIVRINGEKNQIEISYFKHDKPVPTYGFSVTEREGRYGNIMKTDYTKTIVFVTFPFTAEIAGGAYVFDFSIYQRGYWRITVNVTDK